MTLWFASIVVVVGHFALYYSRKGNEAHRQEIILKAGTAFAFIFKAVLGSAVGMAIVPMMWLTVSNEVFTFGGLDNLFNVNRSVTSLLSKEVIIKAKMVALFGIILVYVIFPILFIFVKCNHIQPKEYKYSTIPYIVPRIRKLVSGTRIY